MQKRNRKFTILDGMIVVAATAIAMAWTRSAVRHTLNMQVGVPHAIRFLLWMPIPVPTLVSASIAALVMRCRRPRPRWRQLVYQPGTAASAAVALVATLEAVLFVLAIGLHQIPAMNFDRSAIGSQANTAILGHLSISSLAVIVVWLFLVWGRRWRAEASWIDRTGRLIGFCWIALFLVQGLVRWMIVI